MPKREVKVFLKEQELLQIISGADKRKVTSNDEIARLLGSRNLLADETEIFDSGLKDLDKGRFQDYFKKEFGISHEEKGLTLEEALIAKKVMRNNHLTLAAQSDMELENDVDGEQFIVRFPRKELCP